MYGAAPAAGDSERTAFRRAEKKYKLYKPQAPRSRKNQAQNYTDLSDVIDFRAVLDSVEQSGDTPPGIFRFYCPGFHSLVFCFTDRPGFYFIPRALSVEEQCYWIRESLTTFPQPPNRTNHTATYGSLFDLFNAVQNQKVLTESEISAADEKLGLTSGKSNLYSNKYLFSEANGDTREGVSHNIAASVLLRKLRWSTLGLQFDWSKRNYDVSLPHNKIPDTLCLLAKKMATLAMPSGEEFQPEAAIVNYFGPSDMLGGHLDDMEADWSKPIVSIRNSYPSSIVAWAAKLFFSSVAILEKICRYPCSCTVVMLCSCLGKQGSASMVCRGSSPTMNTRIFRRSCNSFRAKKTSVSWSTFGLQGSISISDRSIRYNHFSSNSEIIILFFFIGGINRQKK